MVDFNQYYTSKNLSDLLTEFISLQEPTSCLELSAGEGALLDAVKSKWSEIKCTTVDIDPVNHSFLTKKFPYDDHFCFDATSYECLTVLSDKKFDLAVCNPPFESISKTEIIEEYIHKAFGVTLGKLKKTRAEIAFLAINITHLKQNGILAIVVPELIIKGLKLSKFRESLFLNYKVESIIECEQKTFKHTEAKTYVLFLKKTKPPKNHLVNYISVDAKLNLKNKSNLFAYELLELFKEHKIKDIDNNSFEIIRGKMSGKECKLSQNPYIHTTNMGPDMSSLNLDGQFSGTSLNLAMAGDIIISRVGTRVLGKTNFIESGAAMISDCIFLIRFKDQEKRTKFVDFWIKNKSNWLKYNSTGTCARHITKTRLTMLIKNLLT